MIIYYSLYNLCIKMTKYVTNLIKKVTCSFYHQPLATAHACNCTYQIAPLLSWQETLIIDYLQRFYPTLLFCFTFYIPPPPLNLKALVKSPLLLLRYNRVLQKFISIIKTNCKLGRAHLSTPTPDVHETI